MKLKRSILAAALSAGMVLGGGFINESFTTVAHAEYQGESLDKIMEDINKSEKEIDRISKEKKEAEDIMEDLRNEYYQLEEEDNQNSNNAPEYPTKEELQKASFVKRRLNDLRDTMMFQVDVIEEKQTDLDDANAILEKAESKLKDYQAYLSEVKAELISKINASNIKDSEKENLIKNTGDANSLEEINVIKDKLRKLTKDTTLPKDKEVPKEKPKEEKPADPTLLADKRELITKIKASNLSDAHKEALIASTKAAKTSNELNEVEARFEKAVEDMRSTPDITNDKNRLIKKIRDSKLSDTKKLDLITEAAGAGTLKELKAIEDKYDKAVKELEESKKPTKSQIDRLKKSIEEAKITLKAVEFLRKYAPHKIADVREELDILVKEQQERIELAEEIIAKAQ